MFCTTAWALNGVPSWNLTPGRSLMTQRVKSALAIQLVANQGLAPLSAPAVASGSSMVEPTRLPLSSHSFTAGFQPGVSTGMPTTSAPPETGLDDTVVDVAPVAVE